MMKNQRRSLEIQRAEIINRLNKEGIQVSIGKRRPINKQYSGIIGRNQQILYVNLVDYTCLNLKL